VPGRLTELEAAFQCRDFATFGSLTMRDSNQFHATCLDSYPPIFYLNEVRHVTSHIARIYRPKHSTQSTGSDPLAIKAQILSPLILSLTFCP
jgi:mevalonate pyrophosphate decarboxylase